MFTESPLLHGYLKVSEPFEFAGSVQLSVKGSFDATCDLSRVRGRFFVSGVTDDATPAMDRMTRGAYLTIIKLATVKMAISPTIASTFIALSIELFELTSAIDIL
jgi:hypothetical protein